MNGLKRRIDRLERVARAGQERPVRVVIMKYGETEAEALKRANLFPEPDDMVIYIIKFCKSEIEGSTLHETKPESIADINAKISEIKAELKQGGMSELEIAEAMAGASPLEDLEETHDTKSISDSFAPKIACTSH